MELNKVLDSVEDSAYKEHAQVDSNLLQTIKKEMSLFKAGAVRGVHLSLAYRYLKSVPPTSVESERVFSASGYLCNKVRSSLNDKTLDELCFLRSHFQLNDF